MPDGPFYITFQTFQLCANFRVSYFYFTILIFEVYLFEKNVGSNLMSLQCLSGFLNGVGRHSWVTFSILYDILTEVIWTFMETELDISFTLSRKESLNDGLFSEKEKY